MSRLNRRDLAVSLAVGLVVGLLGHNISRGWANHQLEVSAWSTLCQIIVDEGFNYNCGDVTRPSAKYTELPEGFDGQYFGGGTVLISIKTQAMGREGALIHEFLHYLHEQLGIITIPDEPKEICWSEQEAWWVQQYFEEQDYSNWWANYRKCWPYYGPLILRSRGAN